MKLIPMKKSDIPGRNIYGLCKNQQVLNEFVASGHECVRVDGFENKSASAAANAMNNSAKRIGLLNVKAISRAGKLYLLREE